jgi:mRNA-degrading endonuclease HigB of HigAB toxin-antitoxin module
LYQVISTNKKINKEKTLKLLTNYKDYYDGVAYEYQDTNLLIRNLKVVDTASLDQKSHLQLLFKQLKEKEVDLPSKLKNQYFNQPDILSDDTALLILAGKEYKIACLRTYEKNNNIELITYRNNSLYRSHEIKIEFFYDYSSFESAYLSIKERQLHYQNKHNEKPRAILRDNIKRESQKHLTAIEYFFKTPVLTEKEIITLQNETKTLSYLFATSGFLNSTLMDNINNVLDKKVDLYERYHEEIKKINNKKLSYQQLEEKIAWKYRHHIIENPPLSVLHFYKVKDSFSLYQEVDNFVTGILAQTENQTVEISDKCKLYSKGFDCNSFKKSPTKKQPKQCKPCG